MKGSGQGEVGGWTMIRWSGDKSLTLPLVDLKLVSIIKSTKEKAFVIVLVMFVVLNVIYCDTEILFK